MGLYYDTDGTYNSAFGISVFTPPFAPQVTLTNPTFPTRAVPPMSTSGALSLRTRSQHQAAQSVDLQRQRPARAARRLRRDGRLRRVARLRSGQRGRGKPDRPGDARGWIALLSRPARRAATRRWTSIDLPHVQRPLDLQLAAVDGAEALQPRVSRRQRYTLSKTMDNTQAQLVMDANTLVYPPDPYDGTSTGHYPLSTSATCSRPTSLGPAWSGPEGASGADGNSMDRAATQRPAVHAALGPTNWSRSGNTSAQDRPNVKPGADPDAVVLGGPDHSFDTSAFVLGPPGLFGNAGRNSLTGPLRDDEHVAGEETSVSAFGAGGRVQLRLEVFNLLNRPNFATPDRVVFAAVTAMSRARRLRDASPGPSPRPARCSSSERSLSGASVRNAALLREARSGRCPSSLASDRTRWPFPSGVMSKVLIAP